MSIGPLQIVIILVLVLIIFGAGKLPKVMGDMGKGVRNLKKGLNEDEEKANKQVSEKGDDSKKDS